MKRNLLKLALCAMAALPLGAWADETTWTWNFTDNGTWNTDKVVTGNEVTLNKSAGEPGEGEHGVTFKFASGKASVTASGLGFLSVDRGSSTDKPSSDYVSISIPAGFKATFNISGMSNNRAIYYAIDNGATVTVTSGTSLYYTNEGNSLVTMTVWAKNPVNGTKSANIISTIVLEDVSSVTYHSWTVNAKIKDTDTQIDTWTVDGIAEDGAFNAYLKKVIKYNEQYYELNDDTYTNLYISDTMGDDNKTYDVTYVLAEDIVFYKEGEAITQSYNETTCSGGAYCGYIGRPVDASAIIIPGAGQYRAEALVMSTRRSPALTLWTGTNIDSSNNTPTAITIGNGNAGVISSEAFTVNTATTYYVGGPASGNSYSNSLAFDYILVRKIGDIVTITSAGFATYVSDSDLNYEGVTGLKAYKATVSGTTIAFEKVTTVPAGEGVLLQGEAGDYNVPVTTGVAAWADDANAFVRGTGAAVASGDGPYNYILNNGSAGVGFYKANGQTVATNRAYLQSTTSSARISLNFDDETTGIEELKNSKIEELKSYYNLSGQRVTTPRKGLYIVNGKKVIIK